MPLFGFEGRTTAMAAVITLAGLSAAPAFAAPAPGILGSASVGAHAASAQAPVLASVDDASGLLTQEDAAAVDAAIAEVRQVTGLNLTVHFFDDSGSQAAFTDRVNQITASLGSSDVLLALDTQLRYGVFQAHNSSSARGSTQQIWEENIVPALSGTLDSGTLRAAAEAAANGLISHVGTAENGAGAGDAGGDFGDVLPWLLPVGAAAAGGAWWLSRRRRSSGSPTAGTSGPSAQPTDAASPVVWSDAEIAAQRKTAGSLLVAADDAVRSSAQDVEFARAQYGDAAVASFEADLAEAKAHLTRAFGLQQQLDDHIEDTPEEQTAWIREIQQLCHSVDATLEAHRKDFENLRRLEQRAPQEVERLTQEEARVRGLLGPATAEEERLRAAFADAAIAHVADNDEQAESRLDFAASQLKEAGTTGAQSGNAAPRLHAAEEAIDQAEEIIQAVHAAGPALEQTLSTLREAVAATERDLAQVRSLGTARQAPELAAATAAVEHALAAVHAALAAGRPDPAALLKELGTAREELDAPLAGIRSQQEQQARAAESLQSAIYSAQLKVRSASDYIGARRGGVNSTARTRLAEAERHLDEAIQLRNSDPATALNHANRALGLAEQATQEAQHDVAAFDPFGSGQGGYGQRGGYGQVNFPGLGRGRGGFPGYGRRGSSGMDMLGGAVLGGILGSILSGGDNDHGDHWGGGGFGGFSGGGGGFGGFGGDFGGGGGDF